MKLEGQFIEQGGENYRIQVAVEKFVGDLLECIGRLAGSSVPLSKVEVSTREQKLQPRMSLTSWPKFKFCPFVELVQSSGTVHSLVVL